MFVLRVKHLLLACFASIIFVYFTSGPQVINTQNGIRISNKMQNAHVSGDVEYIVDKFIDKFVNESFEDFGNGEPTEATLYLSFGGEQDQDSGSEIEDDDDDDDDEEYSDDNETVFDDDDEEEEENNYDNEAGFDDDNRTNEEMGDLESNDVQQQTHNNDSVIHKCSDMIRGNCENNTVVNTSQEEQLLTRKQMTVPAARDPTLTSESALSFTGSTVPSKEKSDSTTGNITSALSLGPNINEDIKSKIHKQSPIVILKRDKYWPPVMNPSNGQIFKEIDYSKYNPEDRAYLLGRKDVYEERAKVVSEVCRNNPNLITPTSIPNFVWDRTHHPNIVWCEIPKAASTSWMVNFLRLGHYRENDTALSDLTQEERDAIRFETKSKSDNLHYRVLRLFPAPNTTKERREVFSKALRFIIVRHPFTRLLSAYLDKMTTLMPLPRIYNFRELQMAIIEKYRAKNAIPSISDPQFPTFGEFIQYVIDSTEDLKTLKDWKKVICWQPYWAKCGVCAHDFQMIMRTETLESDERFLAKLAGLHELDNIFEWRHEKKNSHSRDDYFKQLSTKQMHQLHQRYLLDFQLFGYSIYEYLKLAYDAPKENT